MTDTAPPGAGADARVHGDPDALAALTIKHVDRPASSAEAAAIFAAAGPASTAPATAKPAAQSSTILAAITAAAPAVVLLADDASRIVHGPALGMNDQLLAAGAIVTVAGAAVAIWGRAQATLPISGLFRVRGAK